MKLASVPCVLLLSMILIGCSGRPNADVLRTYVDAQEAFDKAESLPAPEQIEAFRRVAQTYQGLVDRGTRSASIYYNMGNAWARGEQPGRAIAAYRLALRYRPLDPYIAENMRAVQGETAVTEPPTPLIEHLFFWQDWIGCRQKTLGSLFLTGMTLLLGIVLVFVPHRRVRRLFTALLILTVIASLSVGYDWYRFEGTVYAVVATDRANPRKGNSEQYELAFTTPVPLGTAATVIGERGDWLLLRFGPDREGWVQKNDVVEY